VGSARSIGAAVAFMLAIAIAIVCLLLPAGDFTIWSGLEIDTPAIVGTAVLGIPVASFLGWRLGPGLVGASLAAVIARGLAMASLAVVIGALEAVTVGLVVELPRSNAGLGILVALPYLLAAPIVGIVLFGPLVLLVTMPAGIAWAAMVRLLLGRERWPEVAP
jgi:hypothetical protein